MQLLLTSAAPSNIGQGGDTIIQTQNCVSPCAWVKLIFSVSRIVIFAQGPCSLHAQFSRQLDLCVSSLCKPYLCIVQKNPTQILTVILVQGPCSNIQSHSVQKKKLNSVQRKIRRQARHEVRTSGPALEGSIVSPLVNTMGGLSGGRRGGDVSGAASAPSLVDARLLARALAMDLACGIRCPPFVIRKAYASDGSSTPRRKSLAMR